MSPYYEILRRAAGASCDGREARAVALLVLEEAFGVARVDVYADKVRHFSEEERRRLHNISIRLAAGEPVQYVLGRADFCGLRLRVTPATLIPRPETEELVAWAVAECGGARRVLDAGTGSGCIAVALARALPKAEVEAWDVSDEALAVAARNAADCGVGVRCERVDLLAPPAAGPLFDVIVSNPPYVRLSERAAMEPRVLDHEPATALFVPDADPLCFYRALGALARRRLSPGGRLFVEVNAALGQQTAQCLAAAGLDGVELRRDAFGRDRMVRGVQPPAEAARRA